MDLEKLSLFQRLKEESPKPFKKLFNWALSLAGLSGILLGAKATGVLEAGAFANWFWSACNYSVAVGLAASFVAKTTVDTNKLQAKIDVKEQAQTVVDNAGVTAEAPLADEAPAKVEVEVPAKPTVEGEQAQS